MQLYMQHGHATIHAAWKSSVYMQHGHAAYTCSMDMHDGTTLRRVSTVASKQCLDLEVPAGNTENFCCLFCLRFVSLHRELLLEGPSLPSGLSKAHHHVQQLQVRASRLPPRRPEGAVHHVEEVEASTLLAGEAATNKNTK
jgi:hypothetical protein